MIPTPAPRPADSVLPEGIPAWFAATLAVALDERASEAARGRAADALREVARLATEALAAVNRAAGRSPRRRRV